MIVEKVPAAATLAKIEISDKTYASLACKLLTDDATLHNGIVAFLTWLVYLKKSNKIKKVLFLNEEGLVNEYLKLHVDIFDFEYDNISLKDFLKENIYEENTYCMIIKTEIFGYEVSDIYDDETVKAYLSKSYRILKKNGLLFLAVKNASSYKAVYRLLLGKPPDIFTSRHRSFSFSELLWFLINSGFIIDRSDTINVGYDESFKNDEFIDFQLCKNFITWQIDWNKKFQEFNVNTKNKYNAQSMKYFQREMESRSSYTASYLSAFSNEREESIFTIARKYEI